MRREIPIPDNLRTMDEVLAYTQGYEDAQKKYGACFDCAHSEPFKGGQGRSADEVEAEGNVVGWLLIAIAVFISVCVICAVVVTRQP